MSSSEPDAGGAARTLSEPAAPPDHHENPTATLGSPPRSSPDQPRRTPSCTSTAPSCRRSTFMELEELRRERPRTSSSASSSRSTGAVRRPPDPRYPTRSRSSSTSTTTTTTRFGHLNAVVAEAFDRRDPPRSLRYRGRAHARHRRGSTSPRDDTGRFQYTNTTPKISPRGRARRGRRRHRVFQGVYENVAFAKLARPRARPRPGLRGRCLIVSALYRGDFEDAGAEAVRRGSSTTRAVEADTVALTPPTVNLPTRRVIAYHGGGHRRLGDRAQERRRRPPPGRRVRAIPDRGHRRVHSLKQSQAGRACRQAGRTRPRRQGGDPRRSSSFATSGGVTIEGGHAGTLDPLASGLPSSYWPGHAPARYLVGPTRYVTDRARRRTTTGDAEGGPAREMVPRRSRRGCGRSSGDRVPCRPHRRGRGAPTASTVAGGREPTRRSFVHSVEVPVPAARPGARARVGAERTSGRSPTSWAALPRLSNRSASRTPTRIVSSRLGTRSPSSPRSSSPTSSLGGSSQGKGCRGRAPGELASSITGPSSR